VENNSIVHVENNIAIGNGIQMVIGLVPAVGLFIIQTIAKSTTPINGTTRMLPGQILHIGEIGAIGQLLNQLGAME
jgi:hypothetical protein